MTKVSKKIFSLCLIVTLLINILPATVIATEAPEQEVETYTYDENGNLIQNNSENEAESEIVNENVDNTGSIGASESNTTSIKEQILATQDLSVVYIILNSENNRTEITTWSLEEIQEVLSHLQNCEMVITQEEWDSINKLLTDLINQLSQPPQSDESKEESPEGEETSDEIKETPTDEELEQSDEQASDDEVVEDETTPTEEVVETPNYYELALATKSFDELYAMFSNEAFLLEAQQWETNVIEELLMKVLEFEDDRVEELMLILYSLPNAPLPLFTTMDNGIVEFDISFGNVTFTDTLYSGYDLNGTAITGTHSVNNVYYVHQSSATTNYTVSVGTSSTPTTVDFEIHLCGVNIDAPKATDNHAAAVYSNTSSGTVYIVLDDNTTNTLVAYGRLFSNGNKSALLSESLRFGHAAIEKEINTQGNLVITCQAGLNNYKESNTAGHDCNNSCGVLSAKSVGEAYANSSGNTRTSAAAAIGSAAEISAKSDARTSLSKAPTMGTLYNLIIAGGNITAEGFKGRVDTSVGAYLGGSPGIGVGAGMQQYSIGYALTGLKITGGNINAIAGGGSSACIGGGYHAGYVEVNIYGGTINATQNAAPTDLIRGAGIGGGGGGSTSNATAGATVNIYGGHITASSQYGAAIGASAGGKNGSGQDAIINIYGGYINASTTKGKDGNGAGAAIGTGGSTGTGSGGKATVNIYGGTIIANSEQGADIGGGGTNSTNTTGFGGTGIITITNGNVTAMSGGIGGGNANAGVGGNATLTITGGTINASKIAGGNSKNNNGGRAVVKIDDGIVRAGTIGGGICTGSSTGKIGSAEVDITGGTIYGQFIMDSTALSEGQNCHFKMSGGTIDMSNNGGNVFTHGRDDGACVYIIGGADSTEDIVQMTGGTIKNAHAECGGAIYIAGGGSMTLSGGVIENCTATSGGAIYIDGGDFTMTGGSVINSSADNGGAIYIHSGNLELFGGNLSDNDANKGGAAFISGGNVDVDGCILENNSAVDKGGAIYLYAENDTVVNIFDGIIRNNSAGQYGGAVGADAPASNFITINIGHTECRGVNTQQHADGTCPIISNNTATTLGGAFYVNGDAEKLAMNIYCGEIVDNTATRNPGSNTLNQAGGTVTVWAGNIAPGLMVGGGEYIDNRLQAVQVPIIFYGNYDGAPAEPVTIIVTLGVTVSFPVDIYGRDGHTLTGWATAPDASGMYVPANGKYTVSSPESLVFYAVWDADSTYIVYIPDEMPIDNSGYGEMSIRAQCFYFLELSTLDISVHSDFLLHNNDNADVTIPFMIYSSEFGDYKPLVDGDLAATFQYNNTSSKKIKALLDFENVSLVSGQYTGILTFVVDYYVKEEP